MEKQTIRLKKKLLDLGLTQTDLALELGIPIQRVNDAIYGRPWGNNHLPKIIEFIRQKGNSTTK